MTAPEMEVSMKRFIPLFIIFLLIVIRAAPAQELEVNKEEGGTQEQKESPPPMADLDELHQFLWKKAEAGEFSGAVLIARDGKPLFENAYGYASKRFDVSNTLDTKFNLGSINKIFTSIAILQLAENGKVSLDDPVGKYLDMFPSDIAEKVTLRHLLDMSSGWGDYWENTDFNASQFKLRTVSDYMEFIKDIPLDFEPGTDRQHCNTGFEVAGAVIEKVTGEDYFDYIRTHIYEPLGMTNTDSFHRDGPVKNIATGYTDFTPQGKTGTGYEWSNKYLLSPRGTPAGGGYSTVRDMLKIGQALRNNTVLSEDYTRILWNGFRGDPGDPINPLILERMWVSAGGAPGISAILAIGIESGLTCIVLSNYDFPVAMDIFGEIRRMNLTEEK
jgi:CubicO group peptidase (beta-lactamase class C family)